MITVAKLVKMDPSITVKLEVTNVILFATLLFCLMYIFSWVIFLQLQIKLWLKFE